MIMDRPKQSRTCSLQDLRPDFEEAVQRYISVGEPILACFETTGTTADSSSIFFSQTPVYGAQIISRKQLAVGWFSKQSNFMESIQLSDIVSVTEEQYRRDSVRINCVIVRGSGATVIQCVFANPQMSQDFAHILQKAIDNEKTVSKSQRLSLASIEERMETLTRLYKNGLISDEEFQKKRTELLNQL